MLNLCPVWQSFFLLPVGKDADLSFPPYLPAFYYCSMNNIGVQPEHQKSKSVSHWLLPTDSYLYLSPKTVILPPGIVRMRLTDSCLLPSYIPLSCWD